LQLAGIDRDTPDPPEGVIDRDGVTREPTGLLLELAGFLRQRLGSLRDAGQIEEGIVRLNRKLLGYGITSVQDAGPDNDPARWESFAGLQDSGRLQCRVTMIAGAAHLNEFLAEGRRPAGGDKWLRLGHAKVMLTLTTGALQPDSASLGRIVVEAHQAGFPVAVHAVEQEAVASAARVLGENRFAPPPERLGSWASKATGPPVRAYPLEDRMEHCAECPPELVTQVRRSGVSVVTQPGFVYWNGDRYRERIESSLLEHLYPVGALSRSGVPVAFGSDAPVIDPNPWPGIFSAVTGATRAGASLSPAEETGSGVGRGVSIQAALEIYTLAGARSEGNQNSKGTIRPGKLADLVLVDADPTMAPISGLADIRPVLTVVGGRVAWTDGRVGMDG
jgi:predicted amidohydrolase YtcJ